MFTSCLGLCGCRMYCAAMAWRIAESPKQAFRRLNIRFWCAAKKRRIIVARKALRELTRRDFAKVAASGALSVAAAGPFFLFPERAQAEQKTLRILQWSHFVPAYDQ